MSYDPNSLTYISTYVAEAVGITNTSTDCSASFNAVCASIKTSGGGTIEFQSGKTYYFTNPITYDPTYVSIKGNGCTFDFTGVANNTNCVTFVPTKGGADNDFFTTLLPISGIFFNFPAYTIPVVGFTWDILSFGGVAAVNDVLFRDCTFLGAARLFLTSGGINFDLADHCRIQGSGVVLDVNATNNAGERVAFSNCVINGCQTVARDTLVSGASNFELFFINSSLDGNGVLLNSEGMQALFVACHLENFMNTGSPINVGTNPNSACTIIGGDIVLTGLTSYTFGVSASPSIRGINISNAYVATGGTYTQQLLISGNGPARAWMNTQEVNDQFIAFSSGSNIVADGSFGLGNIQSWTTTGAVSYDGSTGHTANGSMKLLGSTVDVFATINAPAFPSMRGGLSFWYKTTGFSGHSGQWIANLLCLDAKGNTIGNVAAGSGVIGTDTASWTLVTLSANNAAPPGTIQIQVNMQLQSDGAGVATLWIDDIYATLE